MFDISSTSHCASSVRHLPCDTSTVDVAVDNTSTQSDELMDTVDSLMAKLAQRASTLRNEARFAIVGKREQLADLATLLDDSARLLTALSGSHAAAR
jgi:molybdopterin converting factor small subunit